VPFQLLTVVAVGSSAGRVPSAVRRFTAVFAVRSVAKLPYREVRMRASSRTLCVTQVAYGLVLVGLLEDVHE